MRDRGKRLARLAAVYRRPPACDTCRWWQPWVKVFDDRPCRPERCPGCGRVVPIRGTTTFVGVRWELL